MWWKNISSDAEDEVWHQYKERPTVKGYIIHRAQKLTRQERNNGKLRIIYKGDGWTVFRLHDRIREKKHIILAFDDDAFRK